MTETNTESGIEEFLNKLDLAQRDGREWGFLSKGEAATRNISTLLGEDAIKKIGILGRRAVYHVNRLLEPERTQQENDFAKALTANAPELMRKVEKQAIREHKIRNCISGESSDSCMWWTLSPYIYAELQPTLGDKEAVSKLLKWAESWKPFSFDGPNINLDGLSNYQEAGTHSTFTLSLNPEGYSHQFAKEEAKRLVKEVFLKE